MSTMSGVDVEISRPDKLHLCMCVSHGSLRRDSSNEREELVVKVVERMRVSE